MNWLKEHWKKIFLFLLLTLATTLVIWVWYTKNIGLNKKFLLQRRLNKLSEMFKVGLCKEAYEEFTTKESKENKGFDRGYDPYRNGGIPFSTLCSYVNSIYSSFHYTSIVFTGNNRADVRYEYYDNEGQKSIVGTWLYEDGTWKRDY